MGVQVLSLVSLAACDSAQPSSQEYTRQAQTAVFAATQVGTLAAWQATSDYAPLLATQVAQLQQENQNLRGTIEAVMTQGAPLRLNTPPPVALVVTPIANPSALQARYEDLRTATRIDEATGCALDKRGRYSPNDSRIYFAAIGFGLAKGTRHQTRWFFGQTLRYESIEWVADQAYEQICIYFWLEPSYTPFDPGLWRVEFWVDGALVLPVPFEICQVGELC
jgi:hypothetical protein